MKLADYILLAIIIGLCLWVLFRKKKSSGCCGDCSSCAKKCDQELKR